MTDENDRRALRALFFDYAINRQRAAERDARRFVYYTSASTALKIINGAEIWMRSASLMNDASEVHHGIHCLDVALRGEGTEKLATALGPHAGLLHTTLERLHQSAAAMFHATYLTCVSEHKDGQEDQLGRLSMWRAYGGSNGVALVFRGDAMHAASNALAAYSSPVVYTDAEQFRTLFGAACNVLVEHASFIATQPRDHVALDLYEMLHFAVLSTKHPAFEEEMEWRIIHAPYHQSSKRLRPATETISGIPQIVYKLPLRDIPNEGLNGLDLQTSLDRIIIGPTNNAIPLSFVFHEALQKQGIQQPYDKIVISNVPLRVPN